MPIGTRHRMNLDISSTTFGTMMMTEESEIIELKPCPWCGGNVTIIYRSASDMFHIYHCDESGKCDIVGPFKIHKSRAATLEKAAEIWNRRTNDG